MPFMENTPEKRFLMIPRIELMSIKNYRRTFRQSETHSQRLNIIYQNDIKPSSMGIFGIP